MLVRLLVVFAAVLSAASEASGSRSFWASLLLPGAGQYISGQSTTASRFFTVELALWASHLGFKHVGDIRAKNYRTHAAVHAGADSHGKSKQYFDDLGFYESYHQHNRFAVLEDGGRAQLYPDNAEFFWEWDEEASRLRFRDLRNDAQGADRHAVFVTGLIVANHVASAIQAGRHGGSDASGRSEEEGRLNLLVVANPVRSSLALVHRF